MLLCESLQLLHKPRNAQFFVSQQLCIGLKLKHLCLGEYHLLYLVEMELILDLRACLIGDQTFLFFDFLLHQKRGDLVLFLNVLVGVFDRRFC